MGFGVGTDALVLPALRKRLQVVTLHALTYGLLRAESMMRDADPRLKHSLHLYGIET
jgi:hypothetical protein